jgi:hypothetical protein
MRTKIIILSAILLILYLGVLNYISILNSPKFNEDKILFSSEKNSFSFLYINGTYILKDNTVTLGFNGYSWGKADAVWILNGYFISYLDKSIPIDINLRINTVGMIHSNLPNQSALLLINKKKIEIPLNKVNIDTNKKIINYIPDSNFLDNYGNILIPLNREDVLGESEVKLIVPDNTGIDIHKISLEATFKKEIDFISYKSILFFTIVLIIVIGILIQHIFKILNQSFYKNIFFISILVAIIMASFSEDLWDFPLWKQFSYYFYIGNSNPAILWSENPFWVLVPVIFSAPYFFLIKCGISTSPIMLNILLKIPIILSYFFIGYFISKIAVDILNINSGEKIRLLLILWFFNPFVIWQIMWGQRDLVAVAFFIAGIYSILKVNDVMRSGFLFSIAISIKSYIIFPLLPIFLYVYFRPDKILNKIIFLFSTIFPFLLFCLFLPYDLLLRIFVYRISLEGPTISNIDGVTWLSFLNRFLMANNQVILNLITKDIFYLGIASMLTILFLKYRNIKTETITIDVTFKSMIFCIFIFYLIYPIMSPQFLLLALPFIILVLDSSFTILYSIMAILYFYSHFFDFHTFISSYIDTYTNYRLIVGSTIDIAIGLVFSLLLIYYIVYEYYYNKKKLFYFSRDELSVFLFIFPILLLYSFNLEKYEGLTTLVFSFILTDIWLFLISNENNGNLQIISIDKIKFFSYSNTILLATIIYFFVTDPPYYMKNFITIVFFLILLVNIISLSKKRIIFFVILTNIFIPITYGFYSTDANPFMKLVHPQLGIDFLLYSMIIINIIFFFMFLIENIRPDEVVL